jgi:hypothetical protein
MKKLSLLVIPVLLSAGVAMAHPKHKAQLLGAAAGGQFGQPGQLPATVIDPGGPPSANSWVEDGGNGPKPPVARLPIEASAIFVGTTQGGTGIVSAISGIDGGFPQGQVFEEFATFISNATNTQILTNRLFTPWDGGVGLANAACACSPMLCSGTACGATVCDMTTDGGVSQFNVTTQDGGLWMIDCKGY